MTLKDKYFSPVELSTNLRHRYETLQHRYAEVYMYSQDDIIEYSNEEYEESWETLLGIRSTDEMIEQNEEKINKIKEVIIELPPRQKFIVDSLLNGMRIGEIAKELNISPNNVTLSILGTAAGHGGIYRKIRKLLERKRKIEHKNNIKLQKIIEIKNKIKLPKIIEIKNKTRICKLCNNEFIFVSNQIYCKECKKEAHKRYMREWFKNNTIKKDKIRVCKMCNNDFTFTSNNQIYCKPCINEARKKYKAEWAKKKKLDKLDAL